MYVKCMLATPLLFVPYFITVNNKLFGCKPSVVVAFERRFCAVFNLLMMKLTIYDAVAVAAVATLAINAFDL